MSEINLLELKSTNEEFDEPLARRVLDVVVELSTKLGLGEILIPVENITAMVANKTIIEKLASKKIYVLVAMRGKSAVGLYIGESVFCTMRATALMWTSLFLCEPEHQLEFEDMINKTIVPAGYSGILEVQR